MPSGFVETISIEGSGNKPLTLRFCRQRPTKAVRSRQTVNCGFSVTIEINSDQRKMKKSNWSFRFTLAAIASGLAIGSASASCFIQGAFNGSPLATIAVMKAPRHYHPAR
jgi:hypothetical protein